MEDEIKNLLLQLQHFIEKLDPILPRTEEIDWQSTLAAIWTREHLVGYLEPIDNFHATRLDDLLQIERQKESLRVNTAQFCQGLPANNVLLWGARGTGKSSLIHALLNEFHEQGLRLVELQKSNFQDFGKIVSLLKDQPYRFLIVCDDLSFDHTDSSFKELKSILEGSVAATTNNILLYATSNRRHLVAENMRDNLSASYDNGELHESDAVEEKISLSDRFGLWLSFYPFSQEQYLEVTIHWLQQLANTVGCEFSVTDTVKAEALRWALNRGVRNGRTAYYFAKHYIGQIQLNASQGLKS